MKKVYIAHPLSTGTGEWSDMEKNVERYLSFMALAAKEGHTVITWIHHYLLYKNGTVRLEHEEYMAHCLALLDDADEIWICGSPDCGSRGLVIEHDYALEHDIKVVWKPEWCDPNYYPVKAAA
jgi:hypothetical protein